MALKIGKIVCTLFLVLKEDFVESVKPVGNRALDLNGKNIPGMNVKRTLGFLPTSWISSNLLKQGDPIKLRISELKKKDELDENFEKKPIFLCRTRICRIF